MLFTPTATTAIEQAVVKRIDEMRRRLGHVLSEPKRWPGFLRRLAFSRAIHGSNTIEGYTVSREDAIAAVDRENPSQAEGVAWQAVTGYRDALTYILQLADDPHFVHSESLLRALHFMMLQYDLSKNPGKWRPGHNYVRNEASGEIVYEGPDADLVPRLMNELVTNLNGPDGTPPLINAAMAHLNLVMIHPFSDGNGRMARALQTLVLAREGLVDPLFSSIEEYLGRRTPEYYAVLAEVGAGRWSPERDPASWVRFCLTAHFRQAQTQLRRMKEIELLWNELELVTRRRRLPERTISALADAAIGLRVFNSGYRSTEQISLNLASRDLKILAEQGFLIPKGMGRGRYYVASEGILQIRATTRQPRREEDPFLIDHPTFPGFSPD